MTANRLVSFFLLLTVVVGCHEEHSTTTQAREELGGTDDGVGAWFHEDELLFTDYYSQLDTIISERTTSRNVQYYCAENENVSVKWTVNGVTQSNVEEAKQWNGDLQKWLVANAVTFSVEGIHKDLQLEAIVQFPDRNVRRFKVIPTITINKDVSDAFGFTFGTPRVEMSDYVYFDLSPQISSSRLGMEVDWFVFSNGKLVRLYFWNDAYQSDFLGLSQRCKAPNPLKLFDGKILNQQEWTVGTLKMKAYNSSLRDEFGADSNAGMWETETGCLTIERVNP
jgi:hypothetical protein